MLAALLARRRAMSGRAWHWLLASLVFCGIALPWPLWVQHAHPEFWEVMKTQAAHREFGLPPIKRLPQLAGAVLGLAVPWSIAVVAAAWRALREKDTGNACARWMLAWIAIGLLPFVFMKAFERYMLALLCPMAILAAHWLETRAASVQRAHLITAATITAIPAAVFALFVLWFGFGYVLPVAAIALLVATLRVARRQQPDPARTAAMCAAQLCLLIGFVYPSIGINRLPDDLPEDLATSNVQTFARPQPGMLSMHLQRSVPQFWGGEALAERLANFHGYLFVLEADCERVEQAAESRGLAIERVGEFRRSTPGAHG